MVLFMSITRLVFAVLIFVIFVTSAAFSFQSLTGYLISDQVNEGANLTAFLLFFREQDIVNALNFRMSKCLRPL